MKYNRYAYTFNSNSAGRSGSGSQSNSGSGVSICSGRLQIDSYACRQVVMSLPFAVRIHVHSDDVREYSLIRRCCMRAHATIATSSSSSSSSSLSSSSPSPPRCECPAREGTGRFSYLFVEVCAASLLLALCVKLVSLSDASESAPSSPPPSSMSPQSSLASWWFSSFLRAFRMPLPTALTTLTTNIMAASLGARVLCALSAVYVTAVAIAVMSAVARALRLACTVKSTPAEATAMAAAAAAAVPKGRHSVTVIRHVGVQFNDSGVFVVCLLYAL